MPKLANWQEQMRSIVGSKGFTSAADDMAPWLIDWRGRYTGAAAAMVSPQNTQETAEILKIAFRRVAIAAWLVALRPMSADNRSCCRSAE